MNMTLTSFYEELPNAAAPKTEFVKKVADRCGLDAGTVRLWVKGKTKPGKREYLAILSEETGIEIEKLFI